jgi:hypothetical protein
MDRLPPGMYSSYGHEPTRHDDYETNDGDHEVCLHGLFGVVPGFGHPCLPLTPTLFSSLPSFCLPLWPPHGIRLVNLARPAVQSTSPGRDVVLFMSVKARCK